MKRPPHRAWGLMFQAFTGLAAFPVACITPRATYTAPRKSQPAF